MSENWKPGDVAMADGLGYKGVVFRYFRDESKSDEWKTALSGNYYGREVDVRRLVVIDPENREQVERLTALVKDARRGLAVDEGTIGDALREFANPTPPKPDEPTGLGAVVEDADGVRWVRVPGARYYGWVAQDESKSSLAYDSLAAVRVLSEGVTP